MRWERRGNSCRVRFCLFCIPLLVFLAHPTRLRAEQWENLALYGGEILSIVMDPDNPNILYAGTRDAGVFKTTDGATTWTPARQGLTFMPISCLTMDPADSDTLYAGTELHGVWKTRDGGDNWFFAGNGLDLGMAVTKLVIDPGNSAILYAAMRSGNHGNIYKSTDAGATWQQRNQGIPGSYGALSNPIVALSIDPDHPTTLYAGTTLVGAYRSTDGAASWQAVNTGIPQYPNSTSYDEVQALAWNPHTGNTLHAIISGDYYAFDDTTLQWTRIGENAHFGTGRCFLYYHPTNPSIVYASGYSAFGALSGSTDGGSTWSELQEDVSQIAITPTAPDTLFAATAYYGDIYSSLRDGGVYKSGDGGANWSEANTGITARQISAVAISPTDPEHLFTVVECGSGSLFYSSTDQGKTWSKGHYFSGLDSIDFLFVDPADPMVIYAGGWSASFYVSQDGGATFSVIGAVDHVTSMTAAPDGTLYLGSGGNTDSSRNGVYRSTDDGATWIHLQDGLPSGTWIDAVSIDPNDSRTIWAGANTRGGLYRSTDQGQTWSLIGLDNDSEAFKILSIAIQKGNSNHLIVGCGEYSGAGNIFRSLDGGTTWQRTLSDVAWVNGLVAHGGDSKVYYATTEGYGIYRTTDGGANWTPFSNGLFYPVTYGMAATDGTSPYFIAGTYGAGLFQYEEKISISPLSGLVTGEDLSSVTFTVVLKQEPLDEVTITLSSSDPSEGVVSPASLTFNPTNFHQPQTVMVKGIDDELSDGDISYQIRTGQATSSDPYYHQFDPDDVVVKNIDNDTDKLCFPVRQRAQGITIICL